MPKVSIIIRCRNNWTLTKKCINSIIDTTEPELYKLVIVNDGSVDDTFNELMKYKNESSCIVINHKESKGAVTATNSGLKYVFKNSTPYIMILDNDTELLKNNTTWLIDMIKYFEEDESTGIVGACSNKVSGLQNVANTHINQEPKYLISFAWLMSFRCAKDVGLWDEQYNPGNFEDIDVSIRVKKLGYRLKIAKDVFIEHYGHQTFQQINDVKSLVEVNKRKGLMKWGERIFYDVMQ